MVAYKIGYTFDVNTGEYIGEETVWIEKATGTYPCASNVTFLPPPYKKGFKAVWEGEIWKLVEDHRGEVLYSINGFPIGMVDWLGELRQGDITTPPPAEKISEHEHFKWNGESYEVMLDDGYVRDGDDIRIMTWEERVLAKIEPLPESCKIENGKVVALTQDELLEQGKITIEEYNEYVREHREREYRKTTDKIGLMVLRGEATKEEWEEAILEVKARWPYKEA